MITLASDFGSPYPAAMRGVLLRRTGARLVDVSHDLPRQDLRAAAFWLRETLPWYPPATHLAVVDPGVGTDRSAVVVEAGDHLLVGPDNGALLPPARRLAAGGPPDPALYRRAADAGETHAGEDRTGEGEDESDRDPQRDERGDSHDVDDGGGKRDGFEDGERDGSGSGSEGGSGEIAVYRIADAGARSATFHGRDVFAPTAALVHEHGTAPLLDRGLLAPAGDHAEMTLPEATVDPGRARGEVLVVDGFGNAITNVPGGALAGVERVAVGTGDATRSVPVVETFAAVAPGEPLATVGSHGNVELDVNRGRGDEAFGLAPGDRVELVFDP